MTRKSGYTAEQKYDILMHYIKYEIAAHESKKTYGVTAATLNKEESLGT